MTIVSPDTPTTLFLNRTTYMPFMVGAARAAFKNLLTGKAIGIGPEGQHYSIKDVMEKTVLTFADQPLLRSAHQAWIVPTIVTIDPKRFFHHGRGGNDDRMPSVREVYDAFKGICGYCHKKVKWNEVNRNEAASREHLWSLSLGGPKAARWNLLLLHAKCNSFLGNRPVKTDVDGEPLGPGMQPAARHFCLPRGMKPRPEWLKVAPWLAEPEVTLDLS